MNLEKSFPHSLWGRLGLATLVGISCLGISVLLGWHFHLPRLVQVLPGAIAMQYNTALCFLVLGASGGLIVTRRGGVLLPAVGGDFVAIMGGLVIVQYLTGITLGIDTLFFYPWLRTLSADPGRMALTTAVCFFSTGVALAVLAWRPQALVVFAAAHTLPLSLGLASVLGYLLGITHVLPFRFGSQMAIHTALAFVAYGGVMLGYAWLRAPNTDAGFPQWSPVIAVMVVPVLFVAFSAIVPNGSLFSQGMQFLGAILCAGLLGFVIARLPDFRIVTKGLILIAIPLLFISGFVVLVARIKQESGRAQAWSAHSNEVIAKAQTMFTHLLEAENSIRGYLITADPAALTIYERARWEVPKGISQLQSLVQDNPEEQAQVARLGLSATARMASLAELAQAMEGSGRAQAMERVKQGQDTRLMAEFRQELALFLQEEERLDAVRRQTVESMWERFDWLLAAGAAVGLLLTPILAFLFSRGISSRVLLLVDNAQRLLEGKELTPPMAGTDEAAQLDRIFHDMAQALVEATRKEQALIEYALDVICAVDAEGRFVKVSPASLQVWGYQPEELIGRRYIELVAPEEVERTLQMASEIMVGQAVNDFENRYRHKDGTLVDVMWSARWSEADQLIFCVARDITKRKQAEAALRQAEDRYRALVEATSQAVWTADATGQREESIEWWAELTGQTYAEWQGWGWLAVLHPDDREPTRAAWRHALETKTMLEVEYRLRTRTGEYRHFVVRGVPIQEADGSFREWVGTFNDITTRKQAEAALQQAHAELELRVQERTAALAQVNEELRTEIRERQRAEEEGANQRAFLRQVLDLNPNFIFAKDRAGRFTLVNQAMAEAYDTTIEGLLGKTDADFNPNRTEVERFRQDDLAVMETQQEQFRPEEKLTLATGQYRWMQMIKRPIFAADGSVTQLLGVSADITERKRAEEQLRVYATQLELQNRELQDFAYVASHDLQEPLRKIRTFGDRLKAQCGEALDEPCRDYLARMQNAAERMQILIDDLLTFSRVATKAREFVPVDLGQIVQEVLSDLEVRIEKTGGQVELGTLPTLNADAMQMRQLFQNLIGNALKFHRPGAAPLVRISSRYLNGQSPPNENGVGSYEILVADNGIGFDEKYCDRIFTVFQRLHGRNEYEGTGIGLAICRKIVERHQGQILADSQPGQGATFIVTLPASQLMKADAL